MLVIVVMFVIATFFIIEDKKEFVVKEEKIFVEEVRTMYFSYIELESYIKNKSVEEAKKNISSIIENISKDNFNLLILQVRPFSDSIYRSNIFLPSKSVTDSELPFDILEYFIKCAHNKNIDVHAWINPYRISSSVDFVIEKGHPAYSFIGTNNIQYIEDSGIYYNPSSDEVISLIVSGVEEVVSNYDVDGIHFDDYFYPSDDIDNENYSLYKENGGELSLLEYRLSNVRKMISSVYSSIKAIKENVVFGIAPQGNIDNNYSSVYLDVKTILSNENYVDYIMPQIYFGFENSNKPFVSTIEEWSSLIKVSSIKLIPALSLYKSGNIDKYAGSGSNEWIDNFDILKRQILYSRGVKNYSGFSIFRYDFFYNKDKQNSNMIKEINNIKSIIN